MAINLHCPKCKNSTSLKAKLCSKCGHRLERDRKYRVIVTAHDGKRISKIVDTLSLAKKLESKLRTQVIEKKMLGINKSITIDEAWNRYLVYAKDSKKTWRDDHLRWEKHIRPYLKGKKMDSVTPYDIQNIISKMKSIRDYAPATIRQIICIIKRLYNWCIQMDLYEGMNPAVKIKLPRLNNERTECLTREEIKRLFATLDNWWNKRFALLVKFALYTGCRRGEIFNLKWVDVDLNNGFIVLRDTKGGKDTILPISDEALNIIKQAKKTLPTPKCSFVFPNKWGRKRSYMGNSWTNIKRKANLPMNFRFHGLRHTYASYLASSGKVSLYTLQKLLTHKTPQMTQRYAHLLLVLNRTYRN